MKSLTTSLEQRLKSLADENRDYAPLWESWCINKRKLKSFLQVIIGVFPHYSLHDSSHSRSIANNIEMLLGDDRICLLSATDIWLLLNSIYAHDIGMVTQRNFDKVWTSDSKFREFFEELKFDNSNSELSQLARKIADDSRASGYSTAYETYAAVFYVIADFRRRNHAEASAKAITEQPIDIDLSAGGLIPRRFVDWVGKIVKSHGTDFSFILQLDKRDGGFCRDYVHPRFMATLLCLGDALEMDNARFHSHSELIMARPMVSEMHNKKHESIRQLYITPECIEITAEFETNDGTYPATYRELKWWCDMLKRLVDNTAVHWGAITPDADFGNAPVLNQIRYIADGREMDSNLAELKFEISQKTALNFAQGSNIYSDKRVFLRELLQNAIDASKIQLWQDIEDGRFSSDEVEVKPWDEFQPYHIKNPALLKRYKIEVKFKPVSDTEVEVGVIDLGTGISNNDILHMGKVGESYRIKSKKNRIETMPRWLRPTGNFGIGLQSLFLASKGKTFKCSTRSRMNGERYRIDFTPAEEGHGYLNVRHANNDSDVKYGACFELIHEPDYRLLSYTLHPKFAEMAQAVHNAFDYFIGQKPTYPQAMLGVLELSNYLYEQLGNFAGMFPVVVSVNDDVLFSSDSDSTFLSVFQDARNITNSGDYTFFDVDELQCHYWNASEMYYSCTNLAQNGGDGLKLCFKDISVFTPHNLVAEPILATFLNMFGHEADRLLAIDREKLKDANAIELIRSILNNVASVWIEKFIENIDAIIATYSENPTMNFYSVALFLLTRCMCQFRNCLCCADNRAAVEKLLKSSAWRDISGYKLVNGQYEYGGVSSKMLIEGILRDINYKIHLLRNRSGFPSKSKEMINHMHKYLHSNPPDEIYLSQTPLEEYTDSYCDLTALGEPYWEIYFKIKTTQPIKATECPNFIEMLISFYFSRRDRNRKQIIIANCAKPYDTLALRPNYHDEIPEREIFSSSVCGLSRWIVSPDMIIPITESHIFDLQHNPLAKDEFISRIMDSQQCGEIVKFTHTYQFQSNCHSLDEISDCYKILLGDIYDTCIKIFAANAV